MSANNIAQQIRICCDPELCTSCQVLFDRLTVNNGWTPDAVNGWNEALAWAEDRIAEIFADANDKNRAEMLGAICIMLRGAKPTPRPDAEHTVFNCPACLTTKCKRNAG